MNVRTLSLGRFQVNIPGTKGFDYISVRKRPRGVGGYVYLTGQEWLPAKVPTSAKKAFDVLGRTLNLLLDGKFPVSIKFDTANTFNVRKDIEAACANYVLTQNLYVDEQLVDGFLLVSGTLGVGSSIVCTGDAASIFGFPLDVVTRGTDRHVMLVPGKTSYEYVDASADVNDVYQFRLASFAGASMPWSADVSNKVIYVAKPSELSYGTAVLMQPDGTAACNVLVTVYYEGESPNHGGVVVSELAKRTDESGMVGFSLVKGLPVVVTIHGTNQARRIIVPNVDSFDLFDPDVSAQDDLFKVRVPPHVVGDIRS